MVAPSSPTAASLAAQCALRGLSPSGSINLSVIENTKAIATSSAQTTSATNYDGPQIIKELADLQKRGACETKTITITVQLTAKVLETPDPSHSRGTSTAWIAFTTQGRSLVGRDEVDKSADDTDPLPQSVSEGSDEDFLQSDTQTDSDVEKKGGRGSKPKGCTKFKVATVTDYKTNTVRYMPAPTTLTSKVPGQTTRDHERIVPVSTLIGGAEHAARPFWR